LYIFVQPIFLLIYFTNSSMFLGKTFKICRDCAKAVQFNPTKKCPNNKLTGCIHLSKILLAIYSLSTKTKASKSLSFWLKGHSHEEVCEIIPLNGRF
jgi:hypothetical protein